MVTPKHRRILMSVTIAIAVGTASAAGVALAGGDGGSTKPTSTTGGVVPGGISEAAHQALERLVANGTIRQAQADAVQAEVDAGSVDPKTLVDDGTVSDAQMHAIADIFDQVKQSYGG
jgi:hypothetical protein